MDFFDMLRKIKSGGKIECSYNKGDRVEYGDISLSNKIQKFLKWYQDNMLRKDADKKKCVRELSDFISDMVFWYSILYPDTDVNEMISNMNITSTCFQDTLHRFYNCMTSGYLKEPRFCDRLIFEYGCERGYFYLNHDFIVTEVDHMMEIPEDLSYDYDSFVGKTIFEVIAFFKEHNLYLDGVADVESRLFEYIQNKYMKEELINCIMYRIIEKDSSRSGPKRAMIFAKEFNRDIDVPMMYGVVSSDPYLDEFIKFYFSLGGHSDLICIDNYHWLSRTHQKVDFISMRKLIFEYNIQDGIMDYVNSWDGDCSNKPYQRSLQPTKSNH